MALRPHRDRRRRDHGNGRQDEDEGQSEQEDGHDCSRAPSHRSPLRRTRARHAVRFTYTLVQLDVNRIANSKSRDQGRVGPEKDFKESGPSALPRRKEWQTSWSASQTFRRGDAKRSWMPSRNRSHPSPEFAFSIRRWTRITIGVSSRSSGTATRWPKPPSKGPSPLSLGSI